MYSDSKLWFGTNWIAQYVEFENCSWKIARKLVENEARYTQEDLEESRFYSESCSVFVCEEPVGFTQAVIKIRMQIPYFEAEFESPEVRAQQIFKAWKHETQDYNDWIPGGFIDYILMTRLEGNTVSPELVRTLSNERQQRLRKAFKTSYMECLDCGFLNLDRGAKNLIWDEGNAQCYIVDWETWCRRKPHHQWDDREYYLWDLL